jgi:hypothetical protein
MTGFFFFFLCGSAALRGEKFYHRGHEAHEGKTDKSRKEEVRSRKKAPLGAKS